MKHHVIKGNKKGTIVFVHGNSSSSTVFSDILNSDLISQTKIAVDLPGHGTNLDGYTKAEDFSVMANRNKLIAFINAIDDDILLVGNSFGGHLAIEVANYIKRLKGLVIFGTPPIKKPINFDEIYLPLKEAQTFFTEKPTDLEIKEVAHVAVFDKQHAALIISDFKNTNPLVRKAIGIDAAENKFSDEYNIFVNLELPKLIIAGKQDASVNLSYLHQVNKACNGHCELIELDMCGHYASLEQSAVFIDAIKDMASRVF